MAISKEAQSNSRYRQALIEKLVAFCSTPEIGGSSEWVRQTASNAFAFMFVNDNGDEGTVKITVSFPKGSRDGDLYDGYTEGEQYREKKEENARKAEERARKAAERKAEQERKKAEKAAAKAAKEKKDEEEKGE